jgi:hypothetical protein
MAAWGAANLAHDCAPFQAKLEWGFTLRVVKNPTQAKIGLEWGTVCSSHAHRLEPLAALKTPHQHLSWHCSRFNTYLFLLRHSEAARTTSCPASRTSHLPDFFNTVSAVLGSVGIVAGTDTMIVKTSFSLFRNNANAAQKDHFAH